MIAALQLLVFATVYYPDSRLITLLNRHGTPKV